MELTWYGTAALTLREGETCIAFDPFGGIRPGELKRPPAVLPFEQALGKAGEVFVTHGHFDHICHLPRLYGEGETRISCTAAPERTLLRWGFPARRLRRLEPGWAGKAGSFSIRTWQGRHCRFDIPLVLRTVFSRRFWRHPGHLLRLLWLHLRCREGGETLFYEVEHGGVRLQIMGSMGLDGRVDYPTGADVLILPLQGRSDQDTYALELVRRLAPKRVILDHFDNSFEPMTSKTDISGFIRNVERELSIPCETVKPGEPIIIEKEGIER